MGGKKVVCAHCANKVCADCTPCAACTVAICILHVQTAHAVTQRVRNACEMCVHDVHVSYAWYAMECNATHDMHA